MKLLSSKGLGEDIYYLLLCVNIDQVNVAGQHSLSNVVVMDLYVFGPHMIHWVPSQLNATNNRPIHKQPQIIK